MMDAHVEYVGFITRGAHRAYALRVRRAASEPQDVTIVIPIEAFVAGRVRYQDGPEICFLKLQRELVTCTGAMPARELNVTDADLADYRAAHAPKPPHRRPRPPIPQG